MRALPRAAGASSSPRCKRGGGALADEGVNCAVCHIRGGRVLARRKGPASPHDTDVRADYGGPAFCAGCHQFNFPVIAPDPTRQGPGRVTGYTAHPMQDTVAQHARGPHARKECLRLPSRRRRPGTCSRAATTPR